MIHRRPHSITPRLSDDRQADVNDTVPPGLLDLVRLLARQAAREVLRQAAEAPA